MILNSDLKAAFENAVETGTTPAFENLVQTVSKELHPDILADWEKAGRPKGFGIEELLHLPVTFCQAALIEPEITVEAFDLLGAAWLDKRPELLQNLASFDEPAKAPPALWQIFWEDVKAAPLRIESERIMQFNSAMDSAVRYSFQTIVLNRAGVAQALQSGYTRPASMTLESLAEYPEATLGYAFYHQLADNNLDLEIIKDRPYNIFADERANFVMLRLYHTHDFWHVLTGYGVSGIDEIGLQAFQLAQAGTASSARLMALLVARAMFKGFYALPPLFNAIFKGWRHGRQTMGLMAVTWEELLDQPLNELRSRYGIEAVTSNS